MPLTPQQRRLRAQIAALTLHARGDSKELTKAATAAFLEKFEKQADPEGKLPPEERRRRALQLRKAHYLSLALKSSKARAKRKAAA